MCAGSVITYGESHLSNFIPFNQHLLYLLSPEPWAVPMHEKGQNWTANDWGSRPTSAVMFWAGTRERVKDCHRRG